ncbi:MAG: LamG domain-containing protein [Nannocystaceae bacterium]|nr:LamG domain-containing protein [Nannocystaceae bacterium]
MDEKDRRRAVGDRRWRIDDGPSVDPDLIAWYPCDESRTGVGFDASGNGNHGTCSDCPVVTEGLDGGACLFDNGQSIVIEHNASFELQAFTLAAWARPEPLAPDTLYTVVAKPAGTEQRNAYELGFNSFSASDVALMCYGSGTESGCHSTPVVIGQWVHLAMTYDEDGARLYIDGELRAEDTPALDGIGFDGAPLLIGLDYDDGIEAHPMLGLVDDVQLYARALEPDEIAALAAL